MIFLLLENNEVLAEDMPGSGFPPGTPFVDRACAPGERAIEDLCVVRSAFLGFNDLEFFTMWQDYSTCRRHFLTDDVIEYGKCIDRVLKAKADLGDKSYTWVRNDILRYYDVIPALPIVRAPGDKLQAQAECDACEASRMDAQNTLAECQRVRDFYEFKVAERLRDWAICMSNRRCLSALNRARR